MRRTVSAFIISIMALTTVGCANSNEPQESLNNTPSSSIANNSSNTDVTGNISTDTITLTSEVTKLENGLSAVKYSGDYGFDDFLSQGGASSDSDVVAFLSENVLSSEG